MFLATTHLAADLDGLASLVAVSLLDPSVVLGLPAGMEPTARRFWRAEGWRFPPLLERAELIARLDAGGLRAVRVVDTSRRERLGWLGPRLADCVDLEAWDTHPAEAADLPRRLLPDSGATISAIVPLLDAARVRPSRAQAGLFLLGIHADTGHLVYDGTTAGDHEAAARCLDWGAPLEWLERFLPRGHDRAALSLLGELAERAQVVPLGGLDVALATLDQEQRTDGLGGLWGELRAAEGWPAAFLLAADPGGIRVIGRSDGSVDVGAVVGRLGGGGHRGAGSATLRGHSLLEAEAHLRVALGGGEPRLSTAAELATHDVFSVSPGDTVRAVADELRRCRVNALPILDGEQVVGLVSRREVDDALHHGLAEAAVRTISAGVPAVVDPGASAAEVREALLGQSGRLVLVGQPPRGVITRTALFRHTAADPAPGPGARALDPTALWSRCEAALGEAAEAVVQVGAAAAAAGLEAWLVGGPVRDVLLGAPCRDVDVVVVGDAPRLAADLALAHGGQAQAHDEFGTAHWHTADGVQIDLVSARTESYAAPGALPEIRRSALRHDLFRRDFTVNMMAISLVPGSRGQLADPYGGRRDLERRILRVVHGLAFVDDPTRTWRAARFAARMDLRLAPDTQALLREAVRVGALARLSPERLGAEISRLLDEQSVVRGLALAREWDLLGALHKRLAGDPELLTRVAGVREAWVQWRAWRPASPQAVVEPLWIALGLALGTAERRSLGRLTAGVRGRTEAFVAGPGRVAGARKRLAGSAERSGQGAVLAELTPPELIALAGVLDDPEPVAWWAQEGEALRTTIDGARLLAAGVPAGPSVGQALRAAQAAAWAGGDEAAQWAAAVAVAAPPG